MKKILLAALIALTPFSAFADDATALAEERAALFEALANSKTQEIGKAANDAIWELWIIAPDADAQALLDAGIRQMASYDNAGAIEILTKLIDYAPDYAEGWNQRAFAHFRMENYDKSLEDIAQTLEREPKHFGALAGKARILILQGRAKLARETLERALEIHPWLAERILLPEVE